MKISPFYACMIILKHKNYHKFKDIDAFISNSQIE